MPFEFEEYNLQGLYVVAPRVFPDDRGFFLESYKKSDFARIGIDEEFKQDNHSRSTKGVLRGLHYQLPPFAQAKLIRCISGEIWDVVVDVRKSSPTFGEWTAITLSAENKKLFYIPPGFAHGFYTVSETAEIMYKVTSEYSKEHERGIMWNDPEVNIEWPGEDILLSDKDKVYPALKEADVFE